MVEVISEETIAHLIHTFQHSRNLKLKAMAKERLQKLECMECERRQVGSSFETLGDAVVCCSCYYEIGGHG